MRSRTSSEDTSALLIEPAAGPDRPRPEAVATPDRRVGLQGAAISCVAFVVLLATAPPGLWLDEAISVRLAALPFPTLVRFVLDGEPNMALFHVLLWPIAQLHPDDTVLRVLPVAAGSAALGLTYVLGCRVFGRATAIVAVVVLACHGLTSRYATEVRGYSLLVMLTVIAALALIDAVARDRTRSWVVFTIAAVLALGTHYVAVLTIGAQLLALLAVRDRVDRRRLRRVLVVLGIAVAAMAAIWIRSNQSGRVAWIPPLSGAQVRAVLTDLGGGSMLAAVVVGGLAAFASVLAVGGRRSERATAFPELLLVLTAWLPLGAGVLISLVQPLYLPRYFLAVLPPMALLAARGLLSLPRRPVLAVGFGVVVVALLVVAHPDLDHRARERSDLAIDYVVPRLRPGDAVFLPYNEELPALQWYGQDRLPTDVRDARPDTPADALTSDWWWADVDRFGAGLAARADLSSESWQDALRDQDRIWVLSGFLAADPRFHDNGTDAVQVGRVECDRQFFGGIDVVLWARACD